MDLGSKKQVKKAQAPISIPKIVGRMTEKASFANGNTV